MCIFFIFDIILFIMVFLYNDKQRNLYLWMSAAILFTLLGLHNGSGDPHGYGYDYPHYLNFFLGINDMYGNVDSPNTYTLEWPYYYFCKFLRIFGNHDYVYTMGYCLFVNIPFLMFVKKYSKLVPLSILWLFIIQNTDTHLFINSVHRQMIAHSFFMVAMWFLLSIDFKVDWHHNKMKLIAVALCLTIAVLGHSSSYFVIVMLLAVYFMPSLKKKTQIIFVLASMIIGLFLFDKFFSYLNGLMFLLGDVEEISRTTHYLVDDVYDSGKASFNALLPQTLMTIGVIYFSDEKERKTVFTKCLFLATVLVNLFFTVPMISRSLTTLWIMAIAGCIPNAFKNNTKAKVVLAVILVIQLYTAYRAYSSPSFRMLPFKFIWE